MRLSFLGQLYSALNRKIRGPQCNARLHILQINGLPAPIKKCGSWECLERELHRIGMRSLEADRVFGLLLRNFRASPDEIWHDILLFLFWRDLEVILRARLRYHPEPMELFSEITWCFLQALYRIDLEARNYSFARKIMALERLRGRRHPVHRASGRLLG